MPVEVFISHSHKDRDLLDHFLVFLQLGANLSATEIRCTSQLPTALTTGANLADKLRVDLKRCSVFIPVITPYSVRSEWAGFEIGAAWAREKELRPVRAGRATVPALLSGVLTQDLADVEGLMKYAQDLAKFLWTSPSVPAAEISSAAARTFHNWYKRSKYFARAPRAKGSARVRKSGTRREPFDSKRHGALVRAWAELHGAKNPADMGPRNFERCKYDIGVSGGVRHKLKRNADGSLHYQ